jgi:hypothetical protein
MEGQGDAIARLAVSQPPRVRQLITQLIEYAEVSLKTFPYNSVSGGPAMGFLTFKALSTSAGS